MVTALIVAGLLVFVPTAAGHLRAVRDAGRSPLVAAAVDRGEAASLGYQHALEHARGRVLERGSRARWARLTSRQRRQRLRANARETTAISRAIAVRGLDDTGYWEPELRSLPAYATHASMLPTGDVLVFGVRRDPIVFDPQTGMTRAVPVPGLAAGSTIFCSGQALLSDGRVLIVGGTLSGAGEAGPRSSGLQSTFLFDPWTETWEIGPTMRHGRWYPTLMKLSSGDIVIVSGNDENGQGVVNPQMDIYRPGVDSAATPLVPFPAGERRVGVGADQPLSLYPGLFLLPDANAVLAGPARHDSALLDTTVARDRGAALGSAWTQIAANQASTGHAGATTVLEPGLGDFAGSWNVLLTGGAVSGDTPGVSSAQTTVDRLNAGPGAPAWSHDAQDDLQEPRFYATNVLLPDGGVVAVGGGAGSDRRTPTSDGNWWLGDTPRQRLKQVELRRPGARTWRLGAAQQEWRTYHSTALLLPDGRVMSGGDDRHEGPGEAALPSSERVDSAEVFWPPYLFDGDVCAPRPVIRGVGAAGPPPAGARQWATLTYGERFGIFSEHVDGPPMRAVLVAPAAVTHALDMNQRVVPLAVSEQTTGGGLNVTMPATASIAPPGYYMLFIVAADGTPSQSRWVHVLAPAAADAERGGGDPATVSGRWPNPQPRTCANPDGTQRSEPQPTAGAGAGAVVPGTGRPGPTPPATRPAKLPAKLALARAAIDRRQHVLDVFAPISARASGRVDIDLFSAGRHTRLKAPVDARRRRILVKRRIPARQAVLGTGILTLTYRGNSATFPQTVRLRAARGKAKLTARRPTLSARGRLRAAGTISGSARGVVRIELQFGVGDELRMLRFSAKIERGKWTLDQQLTRTARAAIGARAATVQATVLFTGYGAARMRGEMRSYRLLKAP